MPALSGLPLGIMYIAAVLDKEGYQVEVLNTLNTEERDRIEGDRKQVGMTWETIERDIRRRAPDIVGITNPFSAQLGNAIKVSKIVKKIEPSILTVIGGPHVTVCPLETLEQTETLDVAVVGEGEDTILEVARCYETGGDWATIPGIAYRRNGAVKLNQPRTFIENLDKLPLPAYHLVDMREYTSPKRITRHHDSQFSGGIPMITSRGCPFNCVFCSIHLHMGRRYRAHSAEYVLSHMEHLARNYDVKYVHFEDDNFTHDHRRLEGILDGLIEKNLKIHWDTPNGVRADGLNKNLLLKMKRAGCNELRVSPESGSQHVLDNIIGKKMRLESVVEVAKSCKELNIGLTNFFVVGLPGEKKHDMRTTVRFARRLKDEYGAHPSFSIATPYYGTRLYKICQEKGYLTEELSPTALAKASTNTHGLIQTEDFTPDDVYAIIAGFQIREVITRYMRNPLSLITKIIREPQKVYRYVSRLIIVSVKTRGFGK